MWCLDKFKQWLKGLVSKPGRVIKQPLVRRQRPCLYTYFKAAANHSASTLTFCWVFLSIQSIIGTRSNNQFPAVNQAVSCRNVARSFTWFQNARDFFERRHNAVATCKNYFFKSEVYVRAKGGAPLVISQGSSLLTGRLVFVIITQFFWPINKLCLTCCLPKLTILTLSWCLPAQHLVNVPRKQCLCIYVTAKHFTVWWSGFGGSNIRFSDPKTTRAHPSVTNCQNMYFDWPRNQGYCWNRWSMTTR